MQFPSSELKDFFDVILAGESGTYNDHNYYVNGSKLRGYIQGRFGQPYGLLKKDLSKYTVGEIKKFQQNPRNSTGQLWATGRYQIIPDTLKGVAKRMGISDSAKFDADTQDKLALGLLKKRSAVYDYITQQVDDNKSNLEKASLQMAMEWSSLGVPYRVKGRHRMVEKNQSYYAGGGDKAHVTTEVVQDALKKLRKSYGKGKGTMLNRATSGRLKPSDKMAIGYTTIVVTVLGVSLALWYMSRPKK